MNLYFVFRHAPCVQRGWTIHRARCPLRVLDRTHVLYVTSEAALRAFLTAPAALTLSSSIEAGVSTMYVPRSMSFVPGCTLTLPQFRWLGRGPAGARYPRAALVRGMSTVDWFVCGSETDHHLVDDRFYLSAGGAGSPESVKMPGLIYSTYMFRLRRPCLLKSSIPCLTHSDIGGRCGALHLDVGAVHSRACVGINRSIQR